LALLGTIFVVQPACAAGSLGLLAPDVASASLGLTSVAATRDVYSEVSHGPVSLWRGILGSLQQPSCRFIPSCSGYAQIGMRRYGPLVGWIVAMDRYLRCHSWASEDGYPVVGPFFVDPVPA